MSSELLTRRALNRTLLARQLLLQRVRLPALEVIERLVGLQAQQARPPFVGLWSRIEAFRREELLELIRSRAVVRATLMRATLHVMSARHYQEFRATLQRGLTQAVRSVLGARMESFPLEAVLNTARELLEERPRTFTETRAELLQRFPEGDERAMGYTVRTHLPLVIVPEEHEWGYRADGIFANAAAWLGSAHAADLRIRELVLRYLAAFGPATTGDIQAWSGLSGLAPLLKELRPELRVFRDERKRELFDLPDAPVLSEETPAPPCFVADFDNLILSHADRTRVIADEHRPAVVTKNGLVLPTILVDGFVAGTWKAGRVRGTTAVTVSPFAPLPAPAKERLAAEAEPLARFLDPEARGHTVTFEGA